MMRKIARAIAAFSNFVNIAGDCKERPIGFNIGEY
jgi:hypothetical protein